MIYALFIVLVLASCGTYKTEPVKDVANKEWLLVWGDEFDYEGLPDSTKWVNEIGFVRGSELQWYTKNNLKNGRVEDGNLLLEARKERVENPNYEEGHESWKKNRTHAAYTSASVKTHKLFDFTYGRVEVRAKLPVGKGTWPAIWMLGSNISEIGWPDCGEIDILENVGFDPNKAHANIHTKAYNYVMLTNKGDSITIDAPYQNYHVYAVNWSKDSLEFFVDDKKYFVFHNEQKGYEEWPFDQDHYLILNLAIGGPWAGKYGIDDEIFPQKFYIDYVRVYQKEST